MAGDDQRAELRRRTRRAQLPASSAGPAAAPGWDSAEFWPVWEGNEALRPEPQRAASGATRKSINCFAVLLA